MFNLFQAPGLVPFEIKQKHHTNGNKDSTVSFVEYIEVNVYGTVYRLLGNKKFTVNGTLTNAPYNEVKYKINVFLNGQYSLVLNTNFGLTVSFDGNSAKVTLCDAYENSVCGLCGNADGKCKIVLGIVGLHFCHK